MHLRIKKSVSWNINTAVRMFSYGGVAFWRHVRNREESLKPDSKSLYHEINKSARVRAKKYYISIYVLWGARDSLFYSKQFVRTTGAIFTRKVRSFCMFLLLFLFQTRESEYLVTLAECRPVALMFNDGCTRGIVLLRSWWCEIIQLVTALNKFPTTASSA